MRVLLLLIAIINYVAGIPFWRIDYTFVEDFQGFFKFHREPLPWHLARKKCSLEGAKLSSPLNKKYTEFFGRQMSEANISSLYTGVHATWSPGEYYTVDGIPFSSLSSAMWRRDGLQYSASLDQCAVMDDSGLLASISCEDAHPFLCVKQMDPHNNASYDDKIESLGYKYISENGKYLKVSEVEMDWHTAFMTCAATGGSLLIPNYFDPNERLFYYDLLMQSEQLYFLGVYRWDNEDDGDWYTVKGDFFDYSRRATSPPGRNCMATWRSIGSSRIVNGTDCSSKHKFICEKNPGSLSMHGPPRATLL